MYSTETRNRESRAYLRKIFRGQKKTWQKTQKLSLNSELGGVVTIENWLAYQEVSINTSTRSITVHICIPKFLRYIHLITKRYNNSEQRSILF